MNTEKLIEPGDVHNLIINKDFTVRLKFKNFYWNKTKLILIVKFRETFEVGTAKKKSY